MIRLPMRPPIFKNSYRIRCLVVSDLHLRIERNDLPTAEQIFRNKFVFKDRPAG